MEKKKPTEEQIAEFRAVIRKDKEARVKKQEEAWDNLPKFVKTVDVPNLPQAEPEVWKSFYVPRLINAGAVPKVDLIDGQHYYGEHRIATIAKWDNKEKQFKYTRYKFGNTFIDTCNHFEDDDGFALFVPIRLATDEEIKNGERGIPDN